MESMIGHQMGNNSHPQGFVAALVDMTHPTIQLTSLGVFVIRKTRTKNTVELEELSSTRICFYQTNVSFPLFNMFGLVCLMLEKICKTEPHYR